ncbi:MAG TPA: hypothetical protein VL485_02715 [Ktedonobacteraceae bacterium]|jgi:hypothetical protein|nr:hypothetical protein [Ktedonobacteraceae bacterium]
MKQHPGELVRWNLFVRELEDLLHNKGWGLNDLITEAGLHPEKVRRLKRSLALPKFHILNPEDMKQVCESFAFTASDQLRLRAAILATAVEETLMNRIDPENALRAAEEIFPLLIDALRQRFGQQSGLAATRGTYMTDAESAPDDNALDPILECFDQAMLAVHLSRQSQTRSERLEQATRARDGFTLVLADLAAMGTVDPAMTQDDVWLLWYQETQKSLAMAEEELLRFQP